MTLSALLRLMVFATSTVPAACSLFKLPAKPDKIKMSVPSSSNLRIAARFRPPTPVSTTSIPAPLPFAEYTRAAGSPTRSKFRNRPHGANSERNAKLTMILVFCLKSRDGTLSNVEAPQPGSDDVTVLHIPIHRTPNCRFYSGSSETHLAYCSCPIDAPFVLSHAHTFERNPRLPRDHPPEEIIRV